MAANIPQMVANGQMMMLQQQQQQQQQQLQQQQQQQQQHQHQQPQNKQLQNLVYTNLMQSMSVAPINSWQAGVSIGDRFAKTSNLVSNTILAFPNNEWQKLCLTAMEWEKKLFLQSPDKQSYDHAMAGRTADMVKRRQVNAPNLQNHVNNDAARQAQLQAAQQRQQQQMMMNQMAARGLGQQQPQHGFQPMQNPMQVPVMPQQPQHMGMGMPTPAMLQNRPDQRQFPMQMGQPPPQLGFNVDPLGQLAPQDRERVHQRAMTLMGQADENQKNQIRTLLQQKMTPAQLQEYAAQGKDPLVTFYQNSALGQLRSQAQAQRALLQQRAGIPPNAMPQGPHQGKMNPGLMANMARQGIMPDGQTFTPSMEDIRNEQQMGLLAQQAGQTVVPASSAPGRNATPGVMAGMPPQHTQGNQQGPNQAQRTPQLQQTFGMPQVKVDPTAAQVQAQPGMRPVAGRPMSGQPGGMANPNAPPQASQSPAMNTLNAPMRQPPIPMGQGQGNGHPMNQANAPMAPTLNPQFNHQNNTRPPSLQGNMNNQAMAGMMPNLGAEANNNMGFYAKMQPGGAANGAFQGPKQGLMAGIPGQAQPGVMNAANQATLVNANQKGNGAMQSAAQPATMQQPKQPSNERDQQFFAYAQSPQGRAQMNNMEVPAPILAQLRNIVPAETRRWAQLRQFFQANPAVMHPQLQGRLNQMQMMQFKNAWEKRIQAAAALGPQGPNANIPPQLAQQLGFQPQPLPPGGSYPPHLSHVTRQELEAARKDARFHGVSDENAMGALRRMKMDHYAKKAWEQYSQTAQQRGNMNLPGGVQKPGVPVPQTPTSQQGGVMPTPQPNAMQGVQHQANQPKPAGAPAPELPAAPAKQARQPPNPSPAPASKSLKRPNPDEASEVPAQPNSAVQRPAPQSETRPAPSGSKPTMEQLMKLSPEQLAKISPEQLARLTPEQQKAIASRSRQGHSAVIIARLRALAHDGHRLAHEEIKQQQQLQLQGLWKPMSPMVVNETRVKLAQAVEKINLLRVGQLIARWYNHTKDDSRARMFFKIRSKVSSQFLDGDQMSQWPETFTITKDELEPYINMMDSMLQDIEMLKRSAGSAGQEGAAAGAQAAGQLPPQPSPLSAANLEKQTQALKQAQNRTAAKTAQPPAAPTTTQPPFQFGVQKSPAGNPEYYGEQRVTQANLVIPPARKKAKTTGAAQASPPAVQHQTPSSSSPQVNAPSPVAVRKPEPPKLTCPDPACEMNAIGFPTEEALSAHRQEEHIKPFENPYGFMQEQMAAALGLDAQGNPKAPPKPSAQGGASTPAAVPMSINRSKQGQKPGAPAMSRGGSMQRQGSAAGAKGAENIGTPGKNAGARPGAGTPQMPVTEDPWMNTTVDPQDLFSGLGRSLEAVTGTVVPDFGTYRSLTPNDTPESSKDSGVSEATSDIAETAALDIDLQVQPLDGDLLFDMTNFNMENFESPDMDMFTNESMMFPLEDMQHDFSKPFRVNQELYSMDL